MQNLKLFISTPFRSFGSPSYFTDALFGVGDEIKRQYTNALVREIESTKDETSGFLVDEIEFGNGPTNSLGTRELMLIMRAIRMTFPLTKDPLIYGFCIPGGVTADFMGFLRSTGFSYLEREMISANNETLKTVNLPPLGDGMQADRYVIQMSGGIKTGVIIDGGIDATWPKLLKTLQEACNQEPSFIRVKNGLTFGSHTDEALHYLRKRGYQGGEEIKSGILYRNGTVLARHPHMPRETQLGFGPRAETIFDGILCKTTGDLKRYIAHSDDFTAIAENLAVENLASKSQRSTA